MIERRRDLRPGAFSATISRALMHLALDIIFNGKLTPRSIWAFYSFGYRQAHHFDADALFGRELREVPSSSWSAFFVGARSGLRTKASLEPGPPGVPARELRNAVPPP